MASEIVQDADAAITSALVVGMQQEARVGLVVPRFFVQESIEGLPTMISKTSKHPVTSDAGSITDGTAMSNTTINPTSVSITAAGLGLKGIITDFSTKGSLLSLQEAAGNFGRALVNKMDVDAAANLANFSNTAGTSGQTLTLGNLATAVYNLENANEAADLVFILHPIQVQHVRQAIIATAAPVWSVSGSGAMADFLSSAQGLGGDANYKGSLLGIPVYSDSNVPASGSDRAGALFRAGRALKWVTKWMPMTETRREPDYPGYMLAVSACYGTGEVFDAAGSSIITLGS